MPLRSTLAGATLASLAVLQGCTTTPPSQQAPSARLAGLACADLQSELTRAQAGQQAAEAAVADAWHVVVPFWVAARYASARSALSEARGQSRQVQAELQRRACDGVAPSSAPAEEVAGAVPSRPADAATSSSMAAMTKPPLWPVRTPRAQEV